MAFSRLLCVFALLLCMAAGPSASAAPETARFDLAGPKVDVRVTRAGKSLPIALVPNLQEADELWLHAELPSTQSVHYLLVAVFLRGTTNPPPDNWIVRIQTWDKHVKSEGAHVTVPAGAQQALLLLAPETGGDLSTLRSAIRGRPGIFVRASQDLSEAGFEQARIEKYLDEMHKVPPTDSKALAEHSDFLARTLNLRPNPDCAKRPVDQQYNCLTQSGTQSMLDDGRGQTIVDSLTSGPSTDLINAASATQMAGGGMYSAYVGAIVDVVRIMSNLHTAHYQYIPAIAFPQEEALNLRLNVPPSFENPKSVIVIGLPAVQKAVPPALRASDEKHVTCLLRPNVTIPLEGAPLVFSTAFAHDLVLRRDPTSAGPEMSLTPDAFQGGLAVRSLTDRRALPAKVSLPVSAPGASSTSPIASAPPPGESKATVTGMWGFDSFSGPTVPVQNTPGTDWKLTTAGDHVILGEVNHLQLASTGTACIQSVVAQEDGQPEQKLEWKPAEQRNAVTVDLKLHSANPGAVRLLVRQFGQAEPVSLSVQAFSKPAELKAIDYHLGDASLTVSGANLAEVRQLQFDDLTFMQPIGSERTVSGTGPAGADVPPLLLKLTSGNPSPKLKAGMQIAGKVTLADGRALSVPFTVQAPRPSMSILSRRVVRGGDASLIQLQNDNDVPLESQLVLSLRSAAPFPRDGQIEIASEDNTLHSKLTLGDGSLVLQDRNTVLAQIDLRKTFGASAFGPLQIRLVLHDGTAGDWQPLATLVRLPVLSDLNCSGTAALNCALTGTDLFLLNTVAGDAAFAKGIDVPDGFTGSMLMVPRPATGGTLYLKLRDDPAGIATAALATHP